jgi:hypothetical protein
MINKEKDNLETNKEKNKEIEAKVDEKVLKEIEEIETKNKRSLTGLWSIPHYTCFSRIICLSYVYRMVWSIF